MNTTETYSYVLINWVGVSKLITYIHVAGVDVVLAVINSWHQIKDNPIIIVWNKMKAKQ